MPKKKRIAKRLTNLFKDITPEQGPVEPKSASKQRASVEKAPSSVAESEAVIQSKQPSRVANTQPAANSSTMSLAFQMGQSNWATLQVLDETEQHRWSQDDQLLVKQVADQLSLA